MDASPMGNRDAQARRAERHDCDGDNSVARNLIVGGACKRGGHDRDQGLRGYVYDVVASPFGIENMATSTEDRGLGVLFAPRFV